MMNPQTPNETKKEAVGKLKHPVEYIEFINWIATPDDLREPKTQRELADKFGVGEDVLSDWKRRDGFWDTVKKCTKTWGKDKTPEVLSALYKRIIKHGNAADVKLWLQYIEGWSEKSSDDNQLVRHFIVTRGSPEEPENIENSS